MSSQLLRTAHQIDLALFQARAIDPDIFIRSPEGRMTDVDFVLLAELAKYHAKKIDAAKEFAYYETTGGEKGIVKATLSQLKLARIHWQNVVDAAEGVYHSDLVFGITPDSPRSKFGHHHSGHWRDRLPELDADLRRISDLKENAPDPILTRGGSRFGGTYSVNPNVRHSPSKSVASGTSLELKLIDLESSREKPLLRASVWARPLDQTRSWHRFVMTKQKDGTFSVALPSDVIDPDFDLQYYFQVYTQFESAVWPSWQLGPPYFVVPVETK